MDANPPGVPVASSASGTRKGTTKPYDPNRFYCPFPGCNRSFAELWRLKVHYRAPPDVRGSGKERGHGAELAGCPKCGMELKPGKHHVGCFGGRANPRQARRARPSKGEVSQLTSHLGQLGGLHPADDSRKKARVGMSGVMPKPPQSEVPLPQPAVHWPSGYPATAAVHMPSPGSVPSGPYFPMPFDFSRFSTPISESATFSRGLSQLAQPVGDNRDQYSPYVYGNVGETPVLATTKFSYDPGFCTHGPHLHQHGHHHGHHHSVPHQPPMLFAGHTGHLPDQKSDVMQGISDNQMLGGSTYSGVDPIQASDLAGQQLFNSMDGLERLTEFWGTPEDVGPMDANRVPRLETWVPGHMAGDVPGAQVGHHQPSEPVDLGAASDALFAAPGGLEPMSFLPDTDGRRRDVPG